AYNNLAGALQWLGRPGEAVTNYQHALRLDPYFAEAHKNLAQVWLLLGNFEQGVRFPHLKSASPGTPMHAFAGLTTKGAFPSRSLRHSAVWTGFASSASRKGPAWSSCAAWPVSSRHG